MLSNASHKHVTAVMKLYGISSGSYYANNARSLPTYYEIQDSVVLRKRTKNVACKLSPVVLGTLREEAARLVCEGRGLKYGAFL